MEVKMGPKWGLKSIFIAIENDDEKRCYSRWGLIRVWVVKAAVRMRFGAPAEEGFREELASDTEQDLQWRGRRISNRGVVTPLNSLKLLRQFALESSRKLWSSMAPGWEGKLSQERLNPLGNIPVEEVGSAHVGQFVKEADRIATIEWVKQKWICFWKTACILPIWVLAHEATCPFRPE